MAAPALVRYALTDMRTVAVERGLPLSHDDLAALAEACLDSHEVRGWVPLDDREVSLWEGLEREDSLANYRAELDAGYETTKRAFR